MMIICDMHQERPTPMIFTFAFPGAEYWCPYCGKTEGIGGVEKRVEETIPLATVAKADKKLATPYLRAVGRLTCYQTKFRGKWIKPCDLPESEQARDAAVIKQWIEQGSPLKQRKKEGLNK